MRNAKRTVYILLYPYAYETYMDLCIVPAGYKNDNKNYKYFEKKRMFIEFFQTQKWKVPLFEIQSIN